jgi:hypothetical protein
LSGNDRFSSEPKWPINGSKFFPFVLLITCFLASYVNVLAGKGEYKGALDVLGKVVKSEGFFSLWKGFTPYYFRYLQTNSLVS